jgi:hypothetical protein
MMFSHSDIETWHLLLLYGVALLTILLLLRYRRRRRRSNEKSHGKGATKPAFLPKSTIRRESLNGNNHPESTGTVEREAAGRIFAPRMTVENNNAPCPVHGVPKVECRVRH